MSGFRPFAPSHLVALALTALIAAGLSWWLRRAPGAIDKIGPVLAVALAGSGMGFVLLDALAGTPWRSIAPLHICDVVVFVGAYALITRRPLASEILYFWGCAGAVGALVTPDLAEDFPHFRFVFYFLQHGLIVAAAIVLVVGARLYPRRKAPLYAWLWLNAYGALVAVVDALFDANFMYLRDKPGAATPLDWLGDWPWYVVVIDVLALACFFLLALPFARRRS